MSKVDQLYVVGSEWKIRSGPATGTRATATNAGTSGQRQAISSISASLSDSAASSAALIVRDGAAGVGTIIWAVTYSVAANGLQAQNWLFPIPLRGSYGNDLTVEFNAVSGTATQNVNANGYLECQYP